VTDEIMAAIGALSGQEYVNIYAKQAKESITERPGDASPDAETSLLSIASRRLPRCRCKCVPEG